MPSPISDHTVPWPDAAVADYVAKGYWAGVPLGALLRDVADRRPDAPALVDPSAGLRLTHRRARRPRRCRRGTAARSGDERGATGSSCSSATDGSSWF